MITVKCALGRNAGMEGDPQDSEPTPETGKGAGAVVLRMPTCP